MAKPHRQFTELLDSAVLQVVMALNAYEKAPQLKTIDAVRKALEEHGLAWAALGAAYPRVFTPGPTLEQLEEDAELRRRDTSPELPHSKRPPPLPRR